MYESVLLEVKPADQGVPTTCSILAYEAGDLIKCALNVHWGNVRGYQGELDAAVGDAITMVRLLCAQLNLNFDSCMLEGEARYMETMKTVHAEGRESL